jgi:hypothetical protein
MPAAGEHNPKRAGRLLAVGLAALIAAALPAFAQDGDPDYGPVEDQPASGGPSLLSRETSFDLGQPRTGLAPSVQISGVYDSGMNGIVIDSQGGIRSAAAAGVQTSFGLNGQWALRHASVSLSYFGSVTRHLSSAAYDSSSQSMSLGYTRRLNRHTSVSVKSVASAYSRSFAQAGLGSGYTPAIDIYGNRASMVNAQAALMVQKTARLSFSVAGNGGITHQTSGMVYDIKSAGVTAEAQYRLGRRATAGASYSFSQYMYPGSFSSTNYHSVSGNYALTLSPRMEFSVSGGYLRSESQFLESVPLDPILAYLLGFRSTMILNHQIRNLPSGGMRLSRKFSQGTADISAGYSVTPGNGIFLASVSSYVSASYSYTGLRAWNLSAGGSYSKAKSLGTSLGYYGTSGANISASRQISRYVHAVASFSTIQYSSGSISYYNRLIYQASFGLGFAPGNIPLGPR